MGKRIALKYCGGCDPGFDRVDYFNRIRNAAGNTIEWVTLDDVDFEAVLLISGCDTDCPRQTIHISPSTRIVSVRNDHAGPEKIVETLLT